MTSLQRTRSGRRDEVLTSMGAKVTEQGAC